MIEWPEVYAEFRVAFGDAPHVRLRVEQGEFNVMFVVARWRTESRKCQCRVPIPQDLLLLEDRFWLRQLAFRTRLDVADYTRRLDLREVA